MLKELDERPLAARGRGDKLCVQAVARESHWGSLTSSWLVKNAFEAWRSLLIIGRPAERALVLDDPGPDLALEMQASMQAVLQGIRCEMDTSRAQLRSDIATLGSNEQNYYQSLMASFQGEFANVTGQITEGLISSFQSELSKVAGQIRQDLCGEVAGLAGILQELRQDILGGNSSLAGTLRELKQDVQGEITGLASICRDMQQESAAMNAAWRYEVAALAGTCRQLQQESDTKILEQATDSTQKLEWHLDQLEKAGKAANSRTEGTLDRIIEELRGLANEAIPMIDELRRRPVEPDLAPVLRAVCDLRMEPDLSQVLNSISMSSLEVIAAVKEAKTDTNPILERMDRLKPDHSEVMALLRKMRADLDLMPLLDGISRIKEPPDVEPILDAIRAIELDLSPVLGAVRKLRGEFPDLSPLQSALETNKLGIISAFKEKDTLLQAELNGIHDKITNLNSQLQQDRLDMIHKAPFYEAIESIDRRFDRINFTGDLSRSLEPIARRADFERVLDAIGQAGVDMSPLLQAVRATQGEVQGAFKAMQDQLRVVLAKADQSQVIKMASDLQMQMQKLLNNPSTREVIVERYTQEAPRQLPTIREVMVPQVPQMEVVVPQVQQVPLAQRQM